MSNTTTAIEQSLM